MSSNDHWRGYFFNLMDRLVRWQKRENHEPIELLTIDVMKDQKNSSSSYNTLLIIGTINSSDSDIRHAMSSTHPNDIAFFDEMNDWFDFGIPFDGSYPAFYHTCGPIDINLNISSVMNEIKNECKERYPGAEINFVGFSSSGNKTGGCYIATAVYGSYDCPEVWTLRRFRDEKLLNNTFGRLFVRVYYATSPTVVRLFGRTKWFNKFWRGRLNIMVEKLKADGYDDTPYYDV